VKEFIAAVTGVDAQDTSRRETTTQRTATSEEIESGQRVWWMLLLAAFVLFVSEAILSRRLKTARIIN
jgi:hypothetical protein